MRVKMTVAVQGEFAIQVEDLTKRFGAFTAVDELSFIVPHGSVFGFLGPNGAGKTTTIGMMLGLIPPDAGDVKIFGFDIRHAMSEILKRTGAIVEGPAFYPYLSGRQNLEVVASLRGIQDQQIVERLIETVGLTERADAKFGGYSQGMRQRLGLASVLINDPQLLILDEPTGGLDPAGQREIRDLIQSLSKAGRTVILSSHQLAEVQEICSHVAIINHGKLVVTGPLDEILGTGHEIEIGLDRPSEAATFLRQLADLEIDHVRVEDGRIIVTTEATIAARINRLLVEGGFEVDLLRPHDDMLEARFLELTSDAEGRESDGAA
jgi:ABC-2 type transport system ATP-binding protein